MILKWYETLSEKSAVEKSHVKTSHGEKFHVIFSLRFFCMGLFDVDFSTCVRYLVLESF